MSRAHAEEHAGQAGVHEYPGQSRPRIGVSACLLGHHVRYDGGHAHDRFLTDVLGPHVEWVPVCPEVEFGLGAPRQSMRLTGNVNAPRLITRNSKEDHTDAFTAFAEGRTDALGTAPLHGYVLKRGSPSCGNRGVKTWQPNGIPAPNARGLFANALSRRFPLLPMEDEGRLRNRAIRKRFVERVLAYQALDAMGRRGAQPVDGRGHAPVHPDDECGSVEPRDLVAYHTRNKLAYLAHSRAHYTRLGQIVAAAGRDPRAALATYASIALPALDVASSRGKHSDVMIHALGHLKRRLCAADKREVLDHIDRYRRGFEPRLAPATLLQHHIRALDVPWLRRQSYFDPPEILLAASAG